MKVYPTTLTPISDLFDCVLQKLEDSVLRDSEDYTLRGEDSNPSKIPARIREIITKNLTSDDPRPSRMASSPSLSNVEEENRLLASELNRVEDLLAASRAERDELGIKYNAMSDKVSVCVWLGWSGGVLYVRTDDRTSGFAKF